MTTRSIAVSVAVVTLMDKDGVQGSLHKLGSITRTAHRFLVLWTALPSVIAERSDGESNPDPLWHRLALPRSPGLFQLGNVLRTRRPTHREEILNVRMYNLLPKEIIFVQK